MKVSQEIKNNRDLYLLELRSGKYKKGTIQSDAKGRPVINSPEDNEGHCACAIMVHLFGSKYNGDTLSARKALGINGVQCGYIQRELNDSPLTFNEIADRIEIEIFK